MINYLLMKYHLHKIGKLADVLNHAMVTQLSNAERNSVEHRMNYHWVMAYYYKDKLEKKNYING